MISMKAFFFNFKKFYKEKTRVRNLLSEASAKQRNISLKIYVRNHFNSYQDVKTMLLKTRVDEVRALQKFEELAFKNLADREDTRIYVRNSQTDQIAHLCRQSLQEIFMEKESSFYEKRIITRFLKQILNTEHYVPFGYPDMAKKFKEYQQQNSQNIQVIGNFLKGFGKIRQGTFKLVDVAHYLYEYKFRRDDVQIIMNFIKKVKSLYNQQQNQPKSNNIDGDKIINFKLLSTQFDIIVNKDKTNCDLIKDLLVNIRDLLNQQIKVDITINGFAPRLDVLSSKQHPRQVKIFGNDNKEYLFLLKGHEDLRQDERVMQLFSLVNRLLTNDADTERKDLTITRYSVIPLSHNTGIIGWVQNCDTLQQLIREYREKSAIRPNAENTLMEQFCSLYQTLPLVNKIEIYRHILENTRGEDVQKVLWIKSPNSETWLERRINYTRSLATMSMVGYILGLGDRHPSNIMLQKYTGKIVHIDFGDCFEVAMKREKFPEKVPFRLTRMLVKAMEACGIEGIYRHTCNTVMRVLRDNKESLLAVLDSFVYDPLLTWRLLNTASNNKVKKDVKIDIKDIQADKEKGSNLIQKVIPNVKRRGSIIPDEPQNLAKAETPKRKESGREKELYFEFADEEREIPDDLQNQKGLEVIDRIKKKLMGRDFKDNETLKTDEQVNQLILQATNHENIAQAYLGWCPFW